ncbi:ATP-binding protein [Nocardia sp. NEAU-G5]|uniref:ATP-binding protein n=1 Tax=Nocardia albiluteola TaxID=2842303 RepID=A0ABS6B380_9NOCA|nr:ATP-binding protein [Nocardia albiluteola]
MLRSFQVTNHRSLAGPQELRLTGSRAGALPAPVTAVHGPAASGKSSLVDALGHMRDAVLNSVTGWDPYAGPARTPHLGFADRPSEFAVTFVAEGIPYSYGFRLDNADICAEWLHSHPHNRKRIVYEREGEQIRVGPMFEPVRYGIGALAPLVRPNALLLSLAGQMYAEALVPAYRWFSTQLEVVRGHQDAQTTAHRLSSHISRSADNAARLLTLLRSAELGIEDILIAEHDPMYADYLRDLDVEIAGAATELDACLASPARAADLERTHGLSPVGLERELSNLRAARDTLFTRMVTRRGAGLSLVHEGSATPFDIADESTATLALLRLLPTVLDALDTGRVLAVDDIDAHLTGDTADRLIQLFQNPETNSRGAQLIFTTRNRTLVDRGNGRSQSRRTTVWQLRRTAQGTSELTAS